MARGKRLRAVSGAPLTVSILPVMLPPTNASTIPARQRFFPTAPAVLPAANALQISVPVQAYVWLAALAVRRLTAALAIADRNASQAIALIMFARRFVPTMFLRNATTAMSIGMIPATIAVRFSKIAAPAKLAPMEFVLPTPVAPTMLPRNATMAMFIGMILAASAARFTIPAPQANPALPALASPMMATAPRNIPKSAITAMSTGMIPAIIAVIFTTIVLRKKIVRLENALPAGMIAPLIVPKNAMAAMFIGMIPAEKEATYTRIAAAIL